MSNHTNKDILFKNLLINRHVGGYLNPQLEPVDQYIREQRKVLDDNNIKLPPNSRYFQNKPENVTQANYNNNTNSTSLNDIASNSSYSGCGNCGKSNSSLYDNLINSELNSSYNISQGNISSGYGLNNSNIGYGKKDVYLRKDADKYDPYSGYLYGRGLMSDGNQRRKIISTFIDINSKFRNTKPSITTNPASQLPPNPLGFTNGSNVITVNHPNNGFSINDFITLTGVVGRYVTLRTIMSTVVNNNVVTSPAFDIPPGTNFMKIYYNHGVPCNYTGNSILVTISNVVGDRGTGTSATFLGSVPVNIINSTYPLQMTLTDNNIICLASLQQQEGTTSCSVAVTTLRNDPNYFTPSPNYFFVILPVIMQFVANQNPYTLADYNFNLSFQALYGIPLNQINASYPTSQSNLYGYQTITSVSTNGYTIELPTSALVTLSDTNCNTGTNTAFGGGNNIYVSEITSINAGYPNPNNYVIDLGEVFHDVISVKLASSEIPNTEKAIKNFPTNVANNKLYWNDIDDGNYLYSIAIPPGNYDTNDLVNALNTQFAATPRINANNSILGTTYTSVHFIQTTINQNTNQVTFSSYKEFIVNNPITDISPAIPSSSVIQTNPNTPYVLTINNPNHGMTSPGMTILIQNAIDDNGIPAAVINGEHVVTAIIDSNTYQITLPLFNLLPDRTETGGGVNVFIYIPDMFRLRFDQPDTLGTVLGFRNPGDPSSVFNYASTISNQDPYAYETAQNSLGQPTMVTNNALQLSGDNYIIMVASPITTYSSIGPIKNAFAKIILCDSPGKILYNTFVPTFQVFDVPIHELYELTVTFYSPDGSLFDFSGVDHSYTLEVITISDIPEGTGISSITGKNYNQTI